ncbi:hypothetical protein LCGC14_1946340 [marine sediment metagenome]|uniref:HNH nuclease domain-containing protein n=1 Tax=marine sediment metagenome TaxID=412755 RepID=A0A0F9G770_9ZZZZ
MKEFRGTSGVLSETRFWDKVEKTDSCWLWLATLNKDGYGRFSVQGRSIYAHRWAWEQKNGPIPEGMELDHECTTTNCVRTDHLSMVTGKENIFRQHQKQRCNYRLVIPLEDCAF